MNKKQQRILAIVIVLLVIGFILYKMLNRKKMLEQQSTNEAIEQGQDLTMVTETRPVGDQRPDGSFAYSGTDTLGNPVSVTPNRSERTR
tara:strand:+ start:3699 stop:3965 length:267 start_codon:yes stop_codon:yes gene_type:complete